MTARQVIVPGAMPSRDSNGRALPAKFRFYAPGTTTPKSVYTDNTLTVTHPFPLLSDSAGHWPSIWVDDAQSFDLGWSDQVFDSVLGTFSGISPAADAVLASTALAQGSADAASASATAAAVSATSAAATATQFGNLSTAITGASASAAAAAASAVSAAASAAAAQTWNPANYALNTSVAAQAAATLTSAETLAIAFAVAL